MMKSTMTTCALILAILSWCLPAVAKEVRYELTATNVGVNLSGKKTVNFALALNGTIPAPTLEFTEGDDAVIVLKNEIPGQEVSVHWHGILLPPEMDGVPYVNTPPIRSGESFTFKFRLRQHGTYWYHSHTMLQEQKGVYGALIVHPKKREIAYDKDVAVVISDWTDENPDQVLKNLRKDGDYYSYKKNTVRSYFGAIQAGGLKNHLGNEWIRMGGMDLSDVGYDAFLMNGKRDTQLIEAHPGEKVRVRLINASASTYFYVSLAGLPMKVISSDGIDISPTDAKEILIGMAETYDVLFTVPEHKNYELRVTAQDVTGHASGWIGMGEKVAASAKPAPDLYMSMANMDHTGGGHGGHGSHGTGNGPDKGHEHHHAAPSKPSSQPNQMPSDSHSNHDHHQTAGHSSHAGATGESKAAPGSGSQQAKLLKKVQEKDAVKNSAEPERSVETLTVDDLRSPVSTELPKSSPFREVKLVLGGDMERYVWFINGKTIAQDYSITVEENQIVRFIFVNDTMMHHPFHLHGHFFRVVNANGSYSPLKHTVDVPPHGSRTIEFYTNEPGDWMLHCHNLYHLKTGMARVVSYAKFKPSAKIQEYQKHDPHLHEHIYNYGLLEAASNHARAEFRVMRSWDEIDLRVESANIDGNNFSFGEEWEAEGDLYYRRWFSRFFNLYGGASVYDEDTYAAVGVSYLLPMLIESSVSFNHEGRVRIDIEKRFQWTESIFSDAEFTWRPDWGGERDTEFEVSLMYGPSWHWAAGLMATEKSVGVGAHVQF